MERGESYVAGAAALNAFSASARVSRDIDPFHDTAVAVEASWQADRALLESHGCELEVLRRYPGFIEAVARRSGEAVAFQWAQDSAFRFFPLVEHEALGLTLHPVDLATHKVLALVGRLEVRDWVDVMTSDEAIQPLGYLAWAASGKDPGFSPAAILEQAARSSRYSQAEVSSLSFRGETPDAGELSRRWRRILDEARRIVEMLPPDDAGTCVLDEHGLLLKETADVLPEALGKGRVLFHPGSIRGAWPRLRTRQCSAQPCSMHLSNRSGRSDSVARPGSTDRRAQRACAGCPAGASHAPLPCRIEACG